MGGERACSQKKEILIYLFSSFALYFVKSLSFAFCGCVCMCVRFCRCQRCGAEKAENSTRQRVPVPPQPVQLHTFELSPTKEGITGKH